MECHRLRTGAVSGSGQTVTYTRTDKTGVNVLKVQDSMQWSASATIVQTSGTSSVQPLAISPTSATISTDGSKAVFTASGGTTPYSWSVGNAAYGSVTPSGAKQCIYVRLAAGNNNVVVTDSKGRAAIADISQPAFTLSVSPASTSSSTNSTNIVFTATGGTSPYTWVVNSGPSGITFNPNPGATTTCSLPAGSQSVQIKVNDGSGANAIATITRN